MMANMTIKKFIDTTNPICLLVDSLWYIAERETIGFDKRNMNCINIDKTLVLSMKYEKLSSFDKVKSITRTNNAAI